METCYGNEKSKQEIRHKDKPECKDKSKRESKRRIKHEGKEKSEEQAKDQRKMRVCKSSSKSASIRASEIDFRWVRSDISLNVTLFRCDFASL